LWDQLPVQAHPILECLIKARLLVAWAEGRQRQLGVAHEALFRSWDRFTTWLNEERDYLLWTERLGAVRAAWERSGRDEGALLRGALLAEAEHWLRDRDTGVSIRDADFIRSSSGFQREEIARWKNLYKEAEQSRKVALARQLASQAQVVRGESSMASTRRGQKY
jgi:hypothetical protein